MPLHTDRANFLLTSYVRSALLKIHLSSGLMHRVKLPLARDKEGDVFRSSSPFLSRDLVVTVWYCNGGSGSTCRSLESLQGCHIGFHYRKESRASNVPRRRYYKVPEKGHLWFRSQNPQCPVNSQHCLSSLWFKDFSPSWQAGGKDVMQAA